MSRRRPGSRPVRELPGPPCTVPQCPRASLPHLVRCRNDRERPSCPRPSRIATTVGATVTVSLTKGANVSLTKPAPGLRAVTVGLGWDARTTDGKDFDLDASAIVCRANGQVVSDKH